MSSYLSDASQDHQLPSLCPDRLTEAGSTAAVRDYLSEVRATLAAAFHPGKSITPFLRDASGAVDTALSHLWEAQVGDSADVALIAVGGYGRGELFPQSDIDILVLTRSTPAEAITLKLEGFITILWDIGLQIGHSVRTLDECAALAQEDLTVITTMMESRLIAGDHALEERPETHHGPCHYVGPQCVHPGKTR